MARLGSLLRSVVWYWLPVVLWMALILSFSSRSDLPVRQDPQTGEPIRVTFTMAKVAHVVEYGGLGLLLMRAWRGSAGWPMRRVVVVTTVAATAFGTFDEYWQSFTPTREPRVTDVVLDGASALVVGLARAAWERRRRPRIGPPAAVPERATR